MRAIRQIDNRLGVDRAAAAEGGLRQLPDDDSVDAKQHHRTTTLVVFVVAAVNVATHVVDAARHFDAHRSQRIIRHAFTIVQHAAGDAECERRAEHLRELRFEASTSRASYANRALCALCASRASRTSLTNGTGGTRPTRATRRTGLTRGTG